MLKQNKGDNIKNRKHCIIGLVYYRSADTSLIVCHSFPIWPFHSYYHQAACSCSDSPQTGTGRTSLSAHYPFLQGAYETGTGRTSLSAHYPFLQGAYAPFRVCSSSLQDACA